MEVSLLPNPINAVEAIKQAAMEAVEAGKTVQFRFGTVLSPDPLEIDLEQKMTLKAANLILTRNVTDYETEVTVIWTTESADGHTHQLSGRKPLTVHNKLKPGERVLLARIQGGTRFLVLDRVE